MTPELWKMLVGAIVLFLSAGAGLLKVWTELAKVKAERAETTVKRDKAEQEIRDMVLRHDFAITQVKDNQALMNTVLDDVRETCSQLNVNIVRLDSTVTNLVETVKEMKS